MKTIGVIGASGLVGEKFTELLQDKSNCNIRLFGQKSVGNKMPFAHKTLTIEPIGNVLDGKIDYAVFCATNEVSAKYIPQLTRNGTVCIDNSSYFRLDESVPLVIDSINGDLIKDNLLIANPNCSTIQVALALYPLLQFDVKKITVATYQSASGAGKDALTDLLQQNTYGKLKGLPHPLYDNLIPQIGTVTATGYTTEEEKMQKEMKKILNLNNLLVNSFCVRVPTTVCHGSFVNVELGKDFCLRQIKDALLGQANVLVFDDAQNGVYPMPTMLRNTKYVGVGRIVKDSTCNGINMWVVADNILRGASYNAYEILNKSMKNRGENE